MRSKEGFIIGIAIFIAFIGIASTLLGYNDFGIVALFVLLLLLLFVLMLQRRQLGRVQARTLKILRIAEEPTRSISMDKEELKQLQRESAVSTKKLVGLLHAQQMSMDLLNEKIDRNFHK